MDNVVKTKVKDIVVKTKVKHIVVIETRKDCDSGNILFKKEKFNYAR